jgi:hypothetical protein
MKIINIIPSTKANKKYTVILSTGKEYSFGLDGSSTYLNHKDITKRLNYWKRHYVSKEKELIDNLIPSPSLFSAYLLWGLYDNLEDNINYLNELWKKKETL